MIPSLLRGSQAWADRAVRIEFEAVFHTATIWLNGVEAGSHVGKGYTAFTLDLSPHLRYAAPNTLLVRADNSFSETMLPRGKSSDWAHDGDIYRPVRLLATPKLFIERMWVDVEPDLRVGTAAVEVHAVVCNSSGAAADGQLGYRLAEDATGLAASSPVPASFRLAASERRTIALPVAKIPQAGLWPFDHPRDRWIKPAGLRMREANVGGSQATRPSPAGHLCVELAPDDAGPRCCRLDGLHHLERVLRELVKRHARRYRAQSGRDPPGVPRQSNRDL